MTFLIDISGATLSTPMTNVAGAKGALRQAQLPRKAEGHETLLADFFRIQSVLSNIGPAFLHFVKSVDGNRKSDEVQIEIRDKPKRSVQLGRSGAHPTVHISVVVDSSLFMR